VQKYQKVHHVPFCKRCYSNK